MADNNVDEKLARQKRMIDQQQQEDELIRIQEGALREKQREDEKLLAQQHAAREEQMMDRHLMQLQHQALHEQQHQINTAVQQHQVPLISVGPPAPPQPPAVAMPPPPVMTMGPPPHTQGPPVLISAAPAPAVVMQPLPPPPPQMSLQMPTMPPNATLIQPPVSAPSMSHPKGPPPPSTDDSGKPIPLMSLHVVAPPGEGGGDDEEEDGSKPTDTSTVRIPLALEQALAFKTERAKEVGVEEADVDDIVEESVPSPPPAPVIGHNPLYLDMEEDEEEKEAKKESKEKKEKKRKEDKNRKKKLKKKAAKKRKQIEKKILESNIHETEKPVDDDVDTDIEIEYVPDDMGYSMVDPVYRQFINVFQAFKVEEKVEELPKITSLVPKDTEKPKKEKKEKKPEKNADDDSDDDDDPKEKSEDDANKISKRKLKLMSRLSIAELKQAVTRPDVVEMHDVTARDPKLLVLLKATRNTVPVPRHWCFKRKYLQGKRGIEKPPFELPDFIQKTGIQDMRAALHDKEEAKSLKAKMREKVRPKLGKIDIDYQKLHDAFFKWQTKPKMTSHGDLYYEGKEFETKLKEKKPGDLSDELKTALGMPVGPNSNKVPPPWLIAMQRYGPPPSYPHLKVAGLNAPIPDQCSFGYHAGGWGKPPVDEFGKPLYGDVFGTQSTEFTTAPVEEEVDHTLWGELESESEESEDEDEEDSDEDEEKAAEDEAGGLLTPAEGLITPSGLSSLPPGLETPDMIELRKKKQGDEMEGGETPALYTILPEKRVEAGLAKSMMGSTHTYDMAAAGGAAQGPQPGGAAAAGVELALDPSELDLMGTDAMAVRYEQTLKEQQNQIQKEDLSDMVAEHAAKQKTKMKRKLAQQDPAKQPKKYKEFKF